MKRKLRIQAFITNHEGKRVEVGDKVVMRLTYNVIVYGVITELDTEGFVHIFADGRVFSDDTFTRTNSITKYELEKIDKIGFFDSVHVHWLKKLTEREEEGADKFTVLYCCTREELPLSVINAERESWGEVKEVKEYSAVMYDKDNEPYHHNFRIGETVKDRAGEWWSIFRIYEGEAQEDVQIFAVNTKHKSRVFVFKSMEDVQIIEEGE